MFIFISFNFFFYYFLYISPLSVYVVLPIFVSSTDQDKELAEDDTEWL